MNYKTGWFWPAVHSVDTLILDFCVLHNSENRFLLFVSHSVYHSLLYQPKWVRPGTAII